MNEHELIARAIDPKVWADRHIPTYLEWALSQVGAVLVALGDWPIPAPSVTNHGEEGERFTPDWWRGVRDAALWTTGLDADDIAFLDDLESRILPYPPDGLREVHVYRQDDGTWSYGVIDKHGDIELDEPCPGVVEAIRAALAGKLP